MKQLDNIIKNKWFKLAKYLIAGILILASIFALLASWYAGKDVAIGTGVVASPDNTNGLKVASLVLGVLGFFVAIFSLANSTKGLPTVIGVVLSVIFFIMLFSIAGTIMTDTKYAVTVGFL